MKIRITETVADWFEDRTITLRKDLYDNYKLVALGNNLIWTLKCYSKGRYMEKYDLAPTSKERINEIIKELNITEIEENLYCKVNQN